MDSGVILPHPEASSNHVNKFVQLAWCQQNGGRRDTGRSTVHSATVLPQSARWIIYESADRRGAGSTRRVSLGANTSPRQSGGAQFVSRPLDFNDGPAVSLCTSPHCSLFLLCQLKTASACESVISAEALLLFFFVFFVLALTPSAAQPPYLPRCHFVTLFFHSPPSIRLFLNCSCPLCPPTSHFQLVRLCLLVCTPNTITGDWQHIKDHVNHSS